MKVILSGTGTSHGIPVIGCNCAVCNSSDQKDTRFRCGAFIFSDEGTVIAIDTPPEFRLQALRYGVTKLDALLVTHSHADHLHGLDDVRIFSHTWNNDQISQEFTSDPPLSVFSNTETLEDLKKRFDYVFKQTQEGGGKPRFNLIEVTQFTSKNPLKIGSLEIEPVPIKHGILNVCGWKITNIKSNKSIAYITDCNVIPDTSIDIIKNVDICVLDSLRIRHHSTHLNFEEGLDYAKKIRAKSTYFTHICHDKSHIQIQQWIKENWDSTEATLDVAYDGLEFSI